MTVVSLEMSDEPEITDELRGFAIDGCVSLGTCKNVTYKREMRTVIHALDVDVVNLFHDVKDLNLTNRYVHRWISPIAIAKI